MRAFLADQPGWKGVGYGLIMLPVGIANFTVVVTMWSVALVGVTFPLWGWAITNRVSDTYVIEGWTKVPYIAGVFVVGVLLLWATPAVVRGVGVDGQRLDQRACSVGRPPNSASASRR